MKNSPSGNFFLCGETSCLCFCWFFINFFINMMKMGKCLELFKVVILGFLSIYLWNLVCCLKGKFFVISWPNLHKVTRKILAFKGVQQILWCKSVSRYFNTRKKTVQTIFIIFFSRHQTFFILLKQQFKN